MHPTQWIELLFVMAVVFVMLGLSWLRTGRWRTFWRGAALLFLVGFAIFYVARPYWIDWQIDKKVAALEDYLQQTYPHESWTLQTVPHREDGYEHLNPYYIGVTFANEPHIEYDYFVRDAHTITQMGWSSLEPATQLKHFEQ